MQYMLKNSALSTANYDALLTGWSALTLQNNVEFSAGSTKNSIAAITARNSIISSYSWSIRDGGTDSAPTMAITSLQVANGSISEDSNLSITFTSDEATTDFIVEDITVVNGTLSNFTKASSTVYTATLTPVAQGLVTIDVAAGAFTDAVNNNNIATTQFNWTYLDSPIANKNVVALVDAWTNITFRWANKSMNAIADRLSWLYRHQDTTKTSYQGIKLHFENKIVDAVMNVVPRSKASIIADIKNIDVLSKNSVLLQNTEGVLVVTSEGIKSDVQGIALNEVARFRDGIISTLNPSFGTVIDDWSMWTSGSLSIGKVSATSNSFKQGSKSTSISLGFDKPIGDNKQDLLGVALSIGQDDTDIGTSSTSNVKSDNYSLSTYSVLKQDNNTTIETVFGLGHLKLGTTRIDGSDTLTGRRNADQVFASALLRDKTIEYNNWSLSPYGKLTLAHTKLTSFSETGGAAALTFNEQTVNDARVYIGVDANYLVTIRNGSIKPFSKLEYGHDISSSSDAIMRYNTESTNYTLKIGKKSKNNWKMDVGADLFTKDEWNSSIAYRREQTANSSHSNSLNFNIELKF